MKDWNVVVTTRDRPRRARRALGELGFVDRTHYRGVLVMNVDNPARLGDELDAFVTRHPDAPQMVSRIVPVTHSFDFKTPEEFEQRSREVAVQLVPELAGKRFFVRMHRRGFKNRLRRPVEEQRLDRLLLEALERAGTPGQIDFENPEAVVVVETVDTRAGISVLAREEMERHPLLRVE